MSKLGFTTDFNALDAFTADAFLIISAEIDKIQEEESKKKRK